MYSRPPPKMEEPKLLPLFEDFLMKISVSARQSHTFSRERVPLECRVLSTEPQFVISDGYHSVSCFLSKEALALFKKAYPLMQIKDLTGFYIVLRSYAPHWLTLRSTPDELPLHIYSFAILRAAKGAEPVAQSPAVGDEKCLTRSRECAINVILRQYMNGRPELGQQLVGNDSYPSSQVILPRDNVKPKLGNFDDLGQQLVSYANIESEERAIMPRVDFLKKEEKIREQRRREEIRRCRKTRACPSVVNHRRLLERIRAKDVPKEASQESDDACLEKEQQTEHARDPPHTPRSSSQPRSQARMSEVKGAKKSPNAKTHGKPLELPFSQIMTRNNGNAAKDSQSKPAITKEALDRFINYRAQIAGAGKIKTNVTDTLQNMRAGSIVVDLHSTRKGSEGNFGVWGDVSGLSSTPRGKRVTPDNDRLAKKSVKKAKYGK